MADKTRGAGHVPGWRQRGPEAGSAHLMAGAQGHPFTPRAQGLRDAHTDALGPRAEKQVARVGSATIPSEEALQMEGGKE